MLEKFESNILVLEDSLHSHNNSHNKYKIIIALSGGLDSVVLLDLWYRLYNKNKNKNKYEITAVYINHQLQAESDSWERFNAEICEKYNFFYKSIKVNINLKNGDSLEAQARNSRYQALSEFITCQDAILVTAQHLNDQAETVLLQLLRSAGPKGLSAMPKCKKFAQGWHIRPLLNFTRKELLDYAVINNLAWVEDKSNQDLKFDRNYIRNKVIPILQERWSDINKILATTAQHCASQDLLLEEYITKDYKHCLECTDFDKKIKISKIKEYSGLKQRAVLRLWFDCNQLLPPGDKILNQIINTCIYSGDSAVPAVVIPSSSKIITKYKGCLCIRDKKQDAKDLSINLLYTLGQSVCLNKFGVKIDSRSVLAQNLNLENDKNYSIYIPLALQSLPITIRSRVGGERCRPIGRGGSTSVKKLLQELNVPPWERSNVLLIYVGDKIAGIVNQKTCEGFSKADILRLQDNPTEKIWRVVCESC